MGGNKRARLRRGKTGHSIFMNADHSSYEGPLPNREPQAPRSIDIKTADADSAVGRNNAPYNPGSEPHGIGSCEERPAD
jgi:hypothetical protein